MKSADNSYWKSQSCTLVSARTKDISEDNTAQHYSLYLTECLTHIELSQCLRYSAMLVYFSFSGMHTPVHTLSESATRLQPKDPVRVLLLSGSQPTPF